MGMPLELNTMIVTKGLEKREGDNTFTLEKDGYRLYPLDIPLEVKKQRDSETNGIGVIKKVVMGNQQTVITYVLISLNSSN